MTRRVRLDVLLVQRELVPSRERAQALILAGAVRVAGHRADRVAVPVAEDALVTIEAGPRFVSRGGDKLEGALDDFRIAVATKVALDVGSSTGGFTDCLLQRGASRVYAVDVGKGQLDWKLRNHPRVRVMEGINAREGFELPEPVNILVADVSFISLRLALPPSFRHVREGGDVIALVKPQFEAGREVVEKGGIVRDSRARAASVVAVAEHFAREGAGVIGVAASRVAGREGNREIFVHAVKGAPSLDANELRRAADLASE